MCVSCASQGVLYVGGSVVALRAMAFRARRLRAPVADEQHVDDTDAATATAASE